MVCLIRSYFKIIPFPVSGSFQATSISVGDRDVSVGGCTPCGRASTVVTNTGSLSVQSNTVHTSICNS